MDRVTYFELAGKRFPCCFSVGAQAEFAQRCGGIEHINTLMDTKDLTVLLQNILWMLSVLMKYGAKHVRFYGEDSPEPPSAEMLQAVVSPAEMPRCQQAVVEAMKAGNHVTTQTAPAKKKTSAASN